jgi:hypothetical protein
VAPGLSLDELAALADARPVADSSELLADLWDSDEELDAFLVTRRVLLPVAVVKVSGLGPLRVVTYISALRGLLTPTRIVTDAGRYRLLVSPDDMDVHNFERLLRDALWAAEEGSLAKAVSSGIGASPDHPWELLRAKHCDSWERWQSQSSHSWPARPAPP